MTAKNLRNVEPYLEDSGFIAKGMNIFALHDPDVHRLGRQVLPWNLSDWQVRENEGEYVQEHFAARLDRNDVLANVEGMMQQSSPSFRTAAILEDKTSGFWLLFEFCDPEIEADQSSLIEEERLHSTQLPHGLAGLNIAILQSQGVISVYMTKHFFLGNVPGKLFLELPRIVSLSVFGSALKDEVQYNTYSSTLSCSVLRRALIRACEMPENVSQKFESEVLDDNDIKIEDLKGSWSLSWEEGHDLPPLVIPPIEVLEQKEVARRYHRLDALIVQADYEQALKQCYEYLAKSPQSLYLIRRLAFLTLWANRPLERHYLELMAKYDPQSFMSVSMWIRSYVQEKQHHQLLEFLSRLGNGLGQSILDFEVADITSLTLPEMLGDAWDVKDDKRAVACYERVLQARGEVPRILVKLIRLMRDLEDPQAEESYMDRLLACEVPVRTRAAIYFRLAEIRESFDKEDAVHWALKSWQTKRSHVRYALLASRLLLLLQRPHEAVHVLVETSDLIAENESVATRLDLELQIATIWLDHLQRYDLAAERLSRARELAGDDPLSFGRMAHIAEHLGDETQHIDLLLLALDTAIKASDKVRADFAVGSLIDLAADLSDVAKQTHIYTTILTHHLIEAPRLARILENAEIKLPYEDILPAIASLLAEKPLAEQGPYFELLGKLCSERLDRPNEACKYFKEVLAADYFSQLAFDFLDAHYSREGLNTDRHKLLTQRYKLAPEQEKSGILRDLFYSDEIVTESERDGYAVQIFVRDADDVGPIEERIALYQQEGKAEAIAQLLESVMRADPTSVGLKTVLELGAQAINSTPEKERFTCLQRIFGKLAELRDDPRGTAKLALTYFWVDSDKTFVAPYLELLVEMGEVPELDSDEMLAVLSDGLPKIQMLISLVPTVSENRAIGYLRRALRLSRQLKVSFELQEGIMQKLSALTILQDDELEEFVHKARDSGKTSQVLSLISQQLKQVQDDTTRAKLCILAGDFLVAGPIDDAELDVVCKSLGFLTSEQQALVKIRWLEVRGYESRLHTRDFALEFLNDSRTWEIRKATVELIDRLAVEDRLAAKKIVNVAIQRFVDTANYDFLEYYLMALEAHTLIDELTMYQVFEAFAKKPDPKRAQKYLLQALANTRKAAEAEKWLNSSQELLVSLDLPRVFQDVLSELLEPNRQATLHPNVLREVGLSHARWQVMQGRDLRKALSLLEQMYAVDQMDPRLWGPLIVIYRELNADTDLYELLYRSLPMIRSNPSIVAPFKIDLLQLEQDVLSMGQRLGLMREQTEVTMVDSQFPFDQSASRPIVGPFGTAVVKAEDPREISTELNLRPLELLDKHKPEPLSFGPSLDQDYDQSEQMTKTLELSIARFSEKGLVPEPLAPPLRSELPPAAQEAERQMPIGLGFSPALSEDEEMTEPDPTKATIPPLPSLPHSMLSISLPPALAPEAIETAPAEINTMSIFRDSKEQKPPLPLEYRESETVGTPNKKFEVESWKMVATQGKGKVGLAEWLLQHQFSDKAEQHLAVQVAALSEDRVSFLDSWSHRVWRYPQENFYELRWADHMSREMFHPGIKAPIVKLLKTLQPLIQQQFAMQLSSKGGAERLKMRLEDMFRVRRKIEWSDELIQRSMLRFYNKTFVEAGFTVYHLPRIEDKIHFHFEEKDIYLDRDYYMTMPPSHLMHRLLFLSRSMQLDCYAFLNLSAHNDIYPFLLKCRRSLEQNRMDNVKRMLGMEKDPLKLILSQNDREHMDTLFAEVGTLTPDKIAKGCNVFVEQIYRINLAETLDLIGLVESIGNVNLLEGNSSTIEITQQNPMIRHLLSFCAELKFTPRDGSSASLRNSKT